MSIWFICITSHCNIHQEFLDKTTFSPVCMRESVIIIRAVQTNGCYKWAHYRPSLFVSDKYTSSRLQPGAMAVLCFSSRSIDGSLTPCCFCMTGRGTHLNTGNKTNCNSSAWKNITSRTKESGAQAKSCTTRDLRLPSGRYCYQMVQSLINKTPCW